MLPNQPARASEPRMAVFCLMTDTLPGPGRKSCMRFFGQARAAQYENCGHRSTCTQVRGHVVRTLASPGYTVCRRSLIQKRKNCAGMLLPTHMCTLKAHQTVRAAHLRHVQPRHLDCAVSSQGVVRHALPTHHRWGPAGNGLWCTTTVQRPPCCWSTSPSLHARRMKPLPGSLPHKHKKSLPGSQTWTMNAEDSTHKSYQLLLCLGL